MSELAPKRLWDSGSNDPSQYARMIPGTSALSHLRIRSTTPDPGRASPRLTVNVAQENAGRMQARAKIRQFYRNRQATDFCFFSQLLAI
ncbi:MAG: hypothetical protein WBW53_02070 [Terriglobales bacterium]